MMTAWLWLLRSCLSPHLTAWSVGPALHVLLWILLPPALQLSSCLPQVCAAAPSYWLPTRISHSETKAKTRISTKRRNWRSPD
ncbi:hypothetical protein CPB84DRAFT_1803845, partial [Gymnopilus junonius]